MFNRLIIKTRGVIIEYISDYNRVRDMFRIMQSPHSRANDRAEGFGGNANMEWLNTLDLLPGITNYQTV